MSLATSGEAAVQAPHINASVERLCAFFGIRPRLLVLGLAFAHCWLFCLPRIASPITSRYVSPLLYLGLSGAMLLCAALSARVRSNLSSRVGVTATATTLGVVATFCLTSGLLVSPSFGLTTALTVTSGVSVGAIYLAWAAFYRELGLRQAVLVLFLTMALGSLLKIPFEMLKADIPTAMLFALLPVVSFSCWVFAMHSLPSIAQQPTRIATGKKIPLGLYACGVAMFGIAIGINRSLSAGFFTATVATAISHLIEVALAIGIIVLVYRQQFTFSFSHLWMIILVVIATGLVIGRLPIPGAAPTSIAVLSSGHMLLVIFYWLSLCDVAHRKPQMPSDVVFGLGWPTYALPMALASLVTIPLAFEGDTISLFIVYALLLSVFFFMGKQPEDDSALFADLNVLATEAAGEPLAARVHALAQANGFSARMEEVALLYAQGRSRSYISQELMLSENTVRDHISNIYRRLDVHNKQQYIDRLQDNTPGV